MLHCEKYSPAEGQPQLLSASGKSQLCPTYALEKRRTRIQTELSGVERRLARWYEAFETGSDEDDEPKLTRIRELEKLRGELRVRLEVIAPLGRTDVDVYTDANLRRFQRCLSDALLVEQSPLARGYLRSLVQRVIVTGPKIVIVSKPAKSGLTNRMTPAEQKAKG